MSMYIIRNRAESPSNPNENTFGTYGNALEIRCPVCGCNDLECYDHDWNPADNVETLGFSCTDCGSEFSATTPYRACGPTRYAVLTEHGPEEAD